MKKLGLDASTGCAEIAREKLTNGGYNARSTIIMSVYRRPKADDFQHLRVPVTVTIWPLNCARDRAANWLMKNGSISVGKIAGIYANCHQKVKRLALDAPSGMKKR